MPVTTVTNPPSPAADVGLVSVASLGPVKIVGVDVGPDGCELVSPGMPVEEASKELTGRSGALLKVLPVLVLL